MDAVQVRSVHGDIGGVPDRFNASLVPRDLQ